MKKKRSSLRKWGRSPFLKDAIWLRLRGFPRSRTSTPTAKQFTNGFGVNEVHTCSSHMTLKYRDQRPQR